MSGTKATIVNALSPGQSNYNTIDDNTRWGQKHWMDSIWNLTDKPMKEVFKTQDFLERLNSRAEESGWKVITEINNTYKGNQLFGTRFKQ